MSITEYKLEELLLYEELERLKEQYNDYEREFIDNIVVTRKIEDVLKVCGRYLSRAKKIMRAYS